MCWNYLIIIIIVTFNRIAEGIGELVIRKIGSLFPRGLRPREPRRGGVPAFPPVLAPDRSRRSNLADRHEWRSNSDRIRPGLPGRFPRARPRRTAGRRVTRPRMSRGRRDVTGRMTADAAGRAPWFGHHWRYAKRNLYESQSCRAACGNRRFRRESPSSHRKNKLSCRRRDSLYSRNQHSRNYLKCNSSAF